MVLSMPDALEREHTLATAVVRFNDLRTRDAMSTTADEMADDEPAHAPRLSREEVLEMLALAEVIARKASYGRQLDVRTARRAGASWAQIGAALGASKQSAWEAHHRWIEQLADPSRRPGYAGFTEAEAEQARRLAGRPGDEDTG
jgi:hypothetical protein